MPTFFEKPALFGAWLAKHGQRESELIVGFYKRHSGRPSMTWAESVDEALCHGWIDGVRTRIDEHSYKIRFTPRKPISTWSAINLERVRVLRRQGLMAQAGLDAFSRRSEARSRIYSYEQRSHAKLEPSHEAMFRKNKAAWKFFEAQPPGYRRLVIFRIISAKRAATREARIAKLIAACENGERL
jgi:uncharacterized protein YdeI (YjbR/CyaY-like superfamily)